MPRGALPPLIISLMASGLLVAFLPMTRTQPLLKQIFRLSIYLFHTEANVKAIMAFAVLAHILEAAYVGWMCVKAKVSWADFTGWVLLGVLLGGPVIYDLGKKIKEKTER